MDRHLREAMDRLAEATMDAHSGYASHLADAMSSGQEVGESELEMYGCLNGLIYEIGDKYPEVFGVTDEEQSVPSEDAIGAVVGEALMTRSAPMPARFAEKLAAHPELTVVEETDFEHHVFRVIELGGRHSIVAAYNPIPDGAVSVPPECVRSFRYKGGNITLVRDDWDVAPYCLLCNENGRHILVFDDGASFSKAIPMDF